YPRLALLGGGDPAGHARRARLQPRGDGSGAPRGRRARLRAGVDRRAGAGRAGRGRRDRRRRRADPGPDRRRGARAQARRGTLGRMVRVAASAPGRERLAALVDWLELECLRLGVDFVTAAPAAHDGAAILCTGSRDGEPTYERDADAVPVLSAATLLAEEQPE